jgi:phosphoglycolate phosphatase-like HAD superfamily hydrolase
MSESQLPASVKAIIFDVEGTLVDAVPHTLQCWSEMLERCGHPVPIEMLRERSGLDGHDMLRELLPAVPDEERKAILKQQGEAYKEHYLPRVTVFAGIRPLFETIKQAGVKIGLATDCSREECDHYLEIAGVRDLLNGSACGTDVKRGKPHPDLLRLALTCLDAESATTAMVGDTPYDMMPARKLGLTAVGVLTGGFTEARLRGAGACCVCSTVTGLSLLPDPPLNRPNSRR